MWWGRTSSKYHLWSSSAFTWVGESQLNHWCQKAALIWRRIKSSVFYKQLLKLPRNKHTPAHRASAGELAPQANAGVRHVCSNVYTHKRLFCLNKIENARLRGKRKKRKIWADHKFSWRNFYQFCFSAPNTSLEILWNKKYTYLGIALLRQTEKCKDNFFHKYTDKKMEFSQS